jgi:hypothetical protein
VVLDHTAVAGPPHIWSHGEEDTMTHALWAVTAGRRRTTMIAPPAAAHQHRPEPDATRPTASAGRSSGAERPLPQAVRARMEAAFGADFSGVTVREDGAAAAMDAVAFTRDETITFRPGLYDQYDLSSPEGLEVIAHELTHVLQQRAGRVPGTGVVEDQGLEAEADEAGRSAPRGEPMRSEAGGPSGDIAPAAHAGGAAPQTGVAQPVKERPTGGTYAPVTEEEKEGFLALTEAEKAAKIKRYQMTGRGPMG